MVKKHGSAQRANLVPPIPAHNSCSLLIRFPCYPELQNHKSTCRRTGNSVPLDVVRGFLPLCEVAPATHSRTRTGRCGNGRGWEEGTSTGVGGGWCSPNPESRAVQYPLMQSGIVMIEKYSVSILTKVHFIHMCLDKYVIWMK